MSLNQRIGVFTFALMKHPFLRLKPESSLSNGQRSSSLPTAMS
jgi:hypothetical protein